MQLKIQKVIEILILSAVMLSMFYLSLYLIINIAGKGSFGWEGLVVWFCLMCAVKLPLKAMLVKFFGKCILF